MGNYIVCVIYLYAWLLSYYVNKNVQSKIYTCSMCQEASKHIHMLWLHIISVSHCFD